MSREEYLNVKNILIRLIDLDMERDELAAEIGVSKAALSTMLSTKRTSLGTAIKLSRALGLTPNQILVGWQDAPPENLAAALTRRATKSRAAVAA